MQNSNINKNFTELLTLASIYAFSLASQALNKSLLVKLAQPKLTTLTPIV